MPRDSFHCPPPLQPLKKEVKTRPGHTRSACKKCGIELLKGGGGAYFCTECDDASVFLDTRRDLPLPVSQCANSSEEKPWASTAASLPQTSASGSSRVCVQGLLDGDIMHATCETAQIGNTANCETAQIGNTQAGYKRFKANPTCGTCRGRPWTLSNPCPGCSGM